jgi:hypothetical protein
VYSRAGLSRIVTLVVSLSLLAVTASASACEFRADRKPFEAAIAGIFATTRHDPAAARLIDRIRNVE